MELKIAREVTRVEEEPVGTDKIVEALKRVDEVYGPWPHSKTWDEHDWIVVAEHFLRILSR